MAPMLAHGARAPYRASAPCTWHSGAMIGSSLKGLSEDGTHLIVVTDDGEEVRLAVTDELRALVRHARVTIRDERPAALGMPPREIQQRIRAGLNAAELAHLTGEPIESLEKFEAPVLAERAYIVELARSTRIGRDSTAPTLGDLVGDRLAGRAIDPASVVWDAWREVDEPWRVAADFAVAGRTVRALWTFDHVAKALTAEDEEATWLTETELLEAPIPRRHLAAVRPDAPTNPLHASASPTDEPGSALDAEEPLSAGDALLRELSERRGTREPVEMDDDDDDEFEGFGPRRGATPPSRPAAPRTTIPHPAGSGTKPLLPPQRNADPSPTPPASTPEAADKRPRKGRASIPSWDEIVFGAKND